jgi:hypothetical protein
MAPRRAGPYTNGMCGYRLSARKRELEQGGHVMRNCLRGFKKALSQSLLAPMSGLASRGLCRSHGGFTSAIVKMVASLLMTISIVTADGAIADEQSERLEQMVPQRPGMKSEEDYRRFARERGLPQRSEPTPKDLDWLRAQSRRERKLEQEYSRRNSSNLSKMSDEEILDAIRLNKGGGSVEPPSVDAREDWPRTPAEFEKKYGRPPQRREEIEFYFDSDDDTDAD